MKNFPSISHTTLSLLFAVAPLIGCAADLGDEEESDLSAKDIKMVSMVGDGDNSNGAIGCAVLKKGVRCWGGRGHWGSLGDGIPSRDRSVYDKPIAPTGLGTKITSIMTRLDYRGTHACVVDDGAVKCWGSVAKDNNEITLKPYTIPGLESNVVHVFGGSYRICGVRDDGKVRCYRNNEDRPARAAEVPGFGDIVQVSGDCALTREGDIRCEQLEEPGTSVSARFGLEANIKRISVDDKTLCAIDANKKLKCFNRETAKPIKTATGSVQDVAVGATAICALMEDTGVKCGSLPGARAQLELGRSKFINEEGVSYAGYDYVFEHSRGVKAIAGGGNNFCLVTETNDVACWGKWGPQPMIYGMPHPVKVGKM